MLDWNEIIERHGTIVWRTAFRLLGNENDVHDCFQETFLAALGVARREQINNWEALLRRLATRHAIDLLIQRSKRRMTSTIAENLVKVRREEKLPEEHLQNREVVEILRQAIGDLPSEQAQLVCLRYFLQMSYEDIASELVISVSAVGVGLHRARTVLREKLEKVLSKIEILRCSG